MRITFFLVLVFYIAAPHMARITSGSTATTMSGNDMKRTRTGITRDRVRVAYSSLDDRTIKRGEQWLPEAKSRIIDGRLSQDESIWSRKLTRVGRSARRRRRGRRRRRRRRTKRAKDSDNRLAEHRRNDLETNDDDGADRDVRVSSNAEGLQGGHPVWQVAEPTAPESSDSVTTGSTVVARTGKTDRGASLNLDSPPSSRSGNSIGYYEEARLPTYVEAEEGARRAFGRYPHPDTLVRVLPMRFAESRREYRPQARRVPVYVLSYPDEHANVSERRNVAVLPAEVPRKKSPPRSEVTPPGNGGLDYYARLTPYPSLGGESKVSKKKIFVPLRRAGMYYHSPSLGRASRERSRWRFGAKSFPPSPRDSTNGGFTPAPRISEDPYAWRNVVVDADDERGSRGDPHADDRAISTLLSFKTHMHRDAEDAGGAYLRRSYLRRRTHDRDYPSGRDDAPLRPDSANFGVPANNSAPLIYPDSRAIIRTRPRLIDDTPDESTKIAVRVADYDNENAVASGAESNIGNLDDGVLDSSSDDFRDAPSYRIEGSEPNVSPSAMKSDDDDDDDDDEKWSLREYGKFRIVESTSVDSRNNLFDSGVDNTSAVASGERVGITYPIDNNQAYYADTSRSDTNDGGDASPTNANCDDGSCETTNFVDNILMQHRSAVDAPVDVDYSFFSSTVYPFADEYGPKYNPAINSTYEGKEIRDDADDRGSEVTGEHVVRSDESARPSPADFDHADRFVDRASFFGDYATEADPFLRSTGDFPPRDGERPDARNSSAILTAIKPLSSELQRLLTVVESVNRSLADVRSRLLREYGQKDVAQRSARLERDSGGERIRPRADNADQRSSLSTRSAGDGYYGGHPRSQDPGVTSRGNTAKYGYFLFYDKLTTASRKRLAKLAGDSKRDSFRRNFLPRRERLNEREMSADIDDIDEKISRGSSSRPKLDDERARGRPSPRRSFVESRYKGITRAKESDGVSSSGNEFSNGGPRRSQDSPIRDKLALLSRNANALPDKASDFSSLPVSSGKRDLERHRPRQVTTSGRPDEGKRARETSLPPVDPRQFYAEATAYLDILRLLDATRGASAELPTVTATSSPAISSVTAAEGETIFSVEATSETVLYEHGTTTTTTSTYAFEYYHEYRKDRERITDKRDYTGMYGAAATVSTVSLGILDTATVSGPPIPGTDKFATSTLARVEETTVTAAIVVPTEATPELPSVASTPEEFTSESTMALTLRLEGMTDVTLRITIPAAIETPPSAATTTPPLIARVETTGEEVAGGTSTTASTQIPLVAPSTFSSKFSTEPTAATAEIGRMTMRITTAPVWTLPSVTVRGTPVATPTERATFTISTTASTISTTAESTISTTGSTITTATATVPTTQLASTTRATTVSTVEVSTTPATSTESATARRTVAGITSSPAVSESSETAASSEPTVETVTTASGYFAPEKETSVTIEVEKTVTEKLLTTATTVATTTTPTTVETPTTTAEIPTSVETRKAATIEKTTTTVETPTTVEIRTTTIKTTTTNETIEETPTSAPGTPVPVETPIISTTTRLTTNESASTSSTLPTTRFPTTTPIITRTPLVETSGPTTVIFPTAETRVESVSTSPLTSPATAETTVETVPTTASATTTKRAAARTTSLGTTLTSTVSPRLTTTTAATPSSPIIANATTLGERTESTAAFATEGIESATPSATFAATSPTFRTTTVSSTLTTTTPSETISVATYSASSITVTESTISTASTTTTPLTNVTPTETPSTATLARTLSTETAEGLATLTTTVATVTPSSEEGSSTTGVTSSVGTVPVLTALAKFLTETIESTSSTLMTVTTTTTTTTMMRKTTTPAAEIIRTAGVSPTTTLSTTEMLPTASSLTVNRTITTEVLGTTASATTEILEGATSPTPSVAKVPSITAATVVTDTIGTTTTSHVITTAALAATTFLTELAENTTFSTPVFYATPSLEASTTVYRDAGTLHFAGYSYPEVRETEFYTEEMSEGEYTYVMPTTVVEVTEIVTPTISREVSSTTEATETSSGGTTVMSLPATERTEHAETTEAAIVTLAPFTSVEITTFAATTTLPKTYVDLEKTEEYTAASIAEAKTPAAETEYYAETAPGYEEKEAEEYEEEYEYDTEVPTDKWYEYEEYETLPAAGRTRTTTVASSTAEEEGKGLTSATTGWTFGSTEEYALPSPTSLAIVTTRPLPLESYSTVVSAGYGTVPAASSATYPTRPGATWRNVTLPRFVTRPEEAVDRETEGTATGVTARRAASTEETERAVSALTSFFVSSTLSTLSEAEASVEGRVTAYYPRLTRTTGEGVAYDLGVSTGRRTEGTVSYAPPFPTSSSEVLETEVTATTSTTAKSDAGRERPREQLLRQLDVLRQREREVAEREDRLRERERQWKREKEQRKKTLRHDRREEGWNVTATAGYVTSADLTGVSSSVAGTTVAVKVASSVPEEATPASGPSETAEATTLYAAGERSPSIETTTAFYAKEERSTSVEYITERPEVTSALYTTERRGTSAAPYTAEEISTKGYTVLTTSHVLATSSSTTSFVPTDLYDVGLVSVRTTVLYTGEVVEETTYAPVASPDITTFSLDEIGAIPTFVAEETYATLPVAYTDIYIGETPTLFGSTARTVEATSPVGVIGATTEYDAEMESLRKELRERERELEEREKMLVEREERLEQDMTEFERCVEEIERREETDALTAAPVEETTVARPTTRPSTPVPPVEETTGRVVATRIVEKTIGRKENRTGVATTSRRGSTAKTKDVEKEERTSRAPEEISMRREEEEEEEEEEEKEEIVTKRICLNVLANTTIPSDKRRRGVAVKDICLPYFPERRSAEKRPVGRLSRKPLTLPSTGEIKGPKFYSPSSYFRYGRMRRRATATGATRKINNLQLSRHEWLSNESVAKPLRHFEGFTRIYGRTGEDASLRNVTAVADARRGNAVDDSRGGIPLYERRALDRRESLLRSAADTAVASSEACGRRRNAPFGLPNNPIPERENDLFDKEDEIRSRDAARDVTPTGENVSSSRSWANASPPRAANAAAANSIESKDGRESEEFYTVNVLRLGYNKTEETHEVVSAKPEDENEASEVFASDVESENDRECDNDDCVVEFEKDDKGAKSYYELEEYDDATGGDNEEEPLEQVQKEAQDERDYTEGITEHYEEHEMTMVYNKKTLDDQSETTTERERSEQVWPTEKSTYHLGGTRFWERDFGVTEPTSDILSAGTTGNVEKTVELSATETTCFRIVLKKHEGSNGAKVRRDVHRREGSAHFTATGAEDDACDGVTSKYDTPIGKRDTALKNLTRKNTSRNKSRTKRSSLTDARPAILNKLRGDSRKLRGSNCRGESAGRGRGTTRLDEFPRTGDESAITKVKSRKLCGVSGNKKSTKHPIVKHVKGGKSVQEDTSGKKRSAKNSQSVHAKRTDSCATSEATSDERRRERTIARTTDASHRFRATKKISAHGGKKKVVRLDDNAGRENAATRTAQSGAAGCSNCICDVANVIGDVRSILDRASYPLDEIKTLNCSRYRRTQDEIVISTDADDAEVAEAFPQPQRYNAELLKGQRYVKLQELEGDNARDSELENGALRTVLSTFSVTSDRDIVSLPGLNLNVPCNQDGDGVTWLSSVGRPSYTWKRTDGVALFGFVAENGDLELRNVNAKDTGNYTCVMTHVGPDGEELVETAYEVRLQVATLPRYVLHGENRYRARSCDERDLDILVTYLPPRLNSIVCEEGVCNAYVLTPSCSRSQITINVLIVPSHIINLMIIDPKRCNVFCLKAIQDKLSLILSRNLLPHLEQRLVPISERPSLARRKRGRAENAFVGGNIGLFSSCPAGYGLRGTHCVPCNIGTYSEDGISQCKKCPPGTYQPNHGARICRTCTNPLTKGCYSMLWNSFSAIMVTLASFGVMVSIFLLLLWIICCAKKKFCVKQMAGIMSAQDAFKQEKHVEEQPLIKDVSENEDQQWDSEYRVKKKKGKFYVNKRDRRQNDKRKYEKTNIRENKWGSRRTKDTPIICLDSYRSHEDYNSHYPKQFYRKGPRLPECDFDT